MNWNVGTRPDEEGTYWAVLIYEEIPNDDDEAVQVAEMATRYFGDRAKVGEEWVMDGEPSSGLVWSQESGSAEGEHVYAWAPLEETPFPALPEGVVPSYTLNN